MSNEKPNHTINYGEKGSAYIKQREDETSWEWKTDWNGIIRHSNSLEEAIEESKNEIEEMNEEFEKQVKKEDDDLDIDSIF